MPHSAYCSYVPAPLPSNYYVFLLTPTPLLTSRDTRRDSFVHCAPLSCWFDSSMLGADSSSRSTLLVSYAAAVEAHGVRLRTREGPTGTAVRPWINAIDRKEGYEDDGAHL